MKDILLNIVTNFVDNPEVVKVKEENDPEGITILKLSVHPDDMGRVIGREGKTISSLRTLMRVAAIKGGKRTRVELIEPTKESSTTKDPT